MKEDRYKNKQLIIIGASGHGKVVADIANLNGYRDIVFLDDNESILECDGYPVIGKCGEVATVDGDVIVAIGKTDIRKKLQQSIPIGRIVTLIHPNAVIAKNVTIGAGTVIMAGAVINSESIIGEGCIINTCSSVDHDCRIGSFVHVAVGSHICGSVNVGDETWIGAGTVVSNNVSVCAGCTIGAGTVVVKDINDVGTYVGVPARRTEMKDISKNLGG